MEELWSSIDAKSRWDGIGHAHRRMGNRIEMDNGVLRRAGDEKRDAIKYNDRGKSQKTGHYTRVGLNLPKSAIVTIPFC